MSEVWLAHDHALDRPVALKLLGPAASGSRFRREARLAASLEHPNIVCVFDYGAVEQRPYLVLEYLPGGTLDELLSSQEGPIDDDRATSIARDLAAGLAHAHARGVVHRDLKPANVLFDGEGHAKIADFGVARLVNEKEAGRLTETGSVLGTALYMAPEQASGARVGPPADVYGFGLILYLLLTGRLPFEAASPVEAAVKRLTEPLRSVEELRPSAPPALAALATSALAVEPADRPADGGSLLAALDGTSTSLLADTLELGPAAWPPSRRGRRFGALAAAVGAVSLAGFGASFILTGEDPAPATPPSTTDSVTRSEKTTSRAEEPTTEGRSSTRAGATGAGPTTAGPGQTEPGPTTTAPPATTEPPPATTEPAPTVTDPGTTATEPVATTTGP